MTRRTNLWVLRCRYRIPLSELSSVSGLPNQYISWAELGEVSSTPRLEDKVPIGGFGLIGISDDSLTRWLGFWWRWRKKRRLIFYRGECKN